MLIREFKILLAGVAFVTFASIPSVAHEREHEDDSDYESSSIMIGGDFDLAMLDDGTVEASLIVDPRQSLESVEIESDGLAFGPMMETEPGVWIADAVVPAGMDCVQAAARMVFAGESEDSHHEKRKARDHDEKAKRHHERGHDDDGHVRSHDDDDDHDGDRHDDTMKRAVVVRLGASVCAQTKTCGTPVPPVVPGPGPGLPPGASLSPPPMLQPLGMFP